MKKKSSLILLLIVAIAALFGSIFASGCKNTEDTKGSIEDYVDYYGCPNSDRVKKLNLKKRRETE